MNPFDMYPGSSVDLWKFAEVLDLSGQLHENERKLFSRSSASQGPPPNTLDIIILDFRKPTPGSPEPYRILNRMNIHKVSVLTRHYAAITNRQNKKLVYSLVLSSFSTKMDFLMDPKFSQYLSQQGVNVISDADFNQLYNLVATDLSSSQLLDFYNWMVEESLRFSGTSDACLGMLLLATSHLPIDNEYVTWNKEDWLLISAKCGAKADGVCYGAAMRMTFFRIFHDMLFNTLRTTRCHVFHAMRNIPHESSFRCISDLFFQSIEWYNMTNFAMIDTALIKNSLYLRFRSEIGEHFAAYESIKRRYAAQGIDFPFLKYLDPDIHDDSLDSYSVEFLACVSKEILMKKGLNHLQHYKVSNRRHFNLSEKLKALIALHS